MELNVRVLLKRVSNNNKAALDNNRHYKYCVIISLVLMHTLQAAAALFLLCK